MNKRRRKLQALLKTCLEGPLPPPPTLSETFDFLLKTDVTGSLRRRLLSIKQGLEEDPCRAPLPPEVEEEAARYLSMLKIDAPP